MTGVLVCCFIVALLPGHDDLFNTFTLSFSITSSICYNGLVAKLYSPLQYLLYTVRLNIALTVILSHLLSSLGCYSDLPMYFL